MKKIFFFDFALGKFIYYKIPEKLANFYNFFQNDVLNVTNDLASAETSYFNANTLQHMSYHTRTPTSSHQLAQHAPNTPTITLTGK